MVLKIKTNFSIGKIVITIMNSEFLSVLLISSFKMDFLIESDCIINEIQDEKYFTMLYNK